MTVEVPVTTGRYHQPSGLVMRLDDQDLDRVRDHSWRLFVSRNHLFAVTGDGTLAHRLLLDAQDGDLIDHINGDGLDNRRANLRHITPSQAAVRAWSRVVLSRKPVSAYRGVSLVEGRIRPWRATISVNRKQHFLGYHPNEVDAAKAYDAAARLYFGEFARTNFGVER